MGIKANTTSAGNTKSQERRMESQRPSSSPAKAESRANVKVTFGTPKKQK